MIIAQAGYLGGRILYMKDGKYATMKIARTILAVLSIALFV